MWKLFANDTVHANGVTLMMNVYVNVHCIRGNCQIKCYYVNCGKKNHLKVE